MAYTIIKYNLIRILLVFAFFIIVWSGLNWINLIVRNLELITSLSYDPVSLVQYLLFSLAVAVDRIIPFVAFLTAIYFAFGLHSSNELNGIQSLGIESKFAYIPFFLFAFLLILVDGYLKFELRPESTVQLQNLEQNIGTKIVVRDQHVGKFLEFPGNIILFVEEVKEDGTLKDIFAHLFYDSNQNVSITFLAESGKIEYNQNGKISTPTIKLNNGGMNTHNHLTNSNYKIQFHQSLTINLAPYLSNQNKAVSSRGIAKILLSMFSPSIDSKERAIAFNEFNQKASKTVFTFMVAVIGGILLVYGNSKRWNIWFSVIVSSSIVFGSFFLGEFTEDLNWEGSIRNLLYYVSSLPMIIITILILFNSRVKPVTTND